MHKRFYRERLHVINSFDGLLYQLHTLSFFLSPSLWLYAWRFMSQVLCPRPRELDPSRSLRFFYFILILLNTPIFWSHSTRGATEGRAIVLDFIGMSYSPSKTQLFALDIFILFLQLLTTTIAYETSVYYTSEDADPQDMLLPDNYTPLSIPLFQTSFGSPTPSPPSPSPPKDLTKFSRDPPIIIDLRIASILAHLNRPPPPPSIRSATNAESVLVNSSNIAPWPLPGIGILMRARRNMRESRSAAGTNRGETEAGDGTREGRIPGALDL